MDNNLNKLGKINYFEIIEQEIIVFKMEMRKKKDKDSVKEVYYEKKYIRKIIKKYKRKIIY